MKKLYAPLLAAACFLAFSAYAQTPTQQDSTKNTDVPNQGQQMNQGDQMHKKSMKKDHAGKMKKSHKQGNATNDNMMNKSDQSQSPDTQKKESGTPGK